MHFTSFYDFTDDFTELNIIHLLIFSAIVSIGDFPACDEATARDLQLGALLFSPLDLNYRLQDPSRLRMRNIGEI